MKFKDLIEEDAGAIFEIEEFAEYVMVDGVILKASLNVNTDKISGNQSLNFDGLHGDFAILYFKTIDYTKKRKRIPKQGEYVYIEQKGKRKRYTVMSAEDDLGVTALKLTAYRQDTLRAMESQML